MRSASTTPRRSTMRSSVGRAAPRGIFAAATWADPSWSPCKAGSVPARPPNSHPRGFSWRNSTSDWRAPTMTRSPPQDYNGVSSSRSAVTREAWRGEPRGGRGGMLLRAHPLFARACPSVLFALFASSRVDRSRPTPATAAANGVAGPPPDRQTTQGRGPRTASADFCSFQQRRNGAALTPYRSTCETQS